MHSKRTAHHAESTSAVALHKRPAECNRSFSHLREDIHLLCYSRGYFVSGEVLAKFLLVLCREVRLQHFGVI